MRIKWGTILEISTKKPKQYLHQKPASRRCGSDQHWYKEDLSFQSRPLERGAKGLPTIVFFSRIWLSLSTPVEIFSWLNLRGLSSLAPRQKHVAKTWMHINGEIETICDENQLPKISMLPPFLEALFRTSFPEVALPTSNYDPNGSVKIAREHSGWPAGSPEESYNEIQQPHDAIFRI